MHFRHPLDASGLFELFAPGLKTDSIAAGTCTSAGAPQLKESLRGIPAAAAKAPQKTSRFLAGRFQEYMVKKMPGSQRQKLQLPIKGF